MMGGGGQQIWSGGERWDPGVWAGMGGDSCGVGPVVGDDEKWASRQLGQSGMRSIRTVPGVLAAHGSIGCRAIYLAHSLGAPDNDSAAECCAA